MKSAQRTAIVGERAIAILVVLLPASMAVKKDFFGDEAHHWLMCTSGSQSRHDAAVVPDQWNFMCSVPVSHASASQSFLISFFFFEWNIHFSSVKSILQTALVLQQSVRRPQIY
jgi:hypothetical protein